MDYWSFSLWQVNFHDSTFETESKRIKSIIMLDGDEMREIFQATKASYENHGRAGRLALTMQYAKLCKLIANQGVSVVALQSQCTKSCIYESQKST